MLAAFAGLLTNVVFGFIKAAILLAAVGSGNVGGYTTASMSAYVWVSQGLLGAIQLSGLAEIGDRIRTGDVAVDFIRPVDMQAAHLATDMGRGTFSLIPRGVPSVLVGAITVGLALPTSVMPYLLGVLSIALGVAISFLGRFALNLAGFWIVETRGLRVLYMVVSTFLAGLFVPVGLFPSWLARIALATPFPSILQTPVDVITGRVTGIAAVEVVGRQLFWVAVTCLVGRAVALAGRRKLEIQGG